jgi:hypothetical protein
LDQLAELLDLASVDLVSQLAPELWGVEVAIFVGCVSPRGEDLEFGSREERASD